MKNDTRAGRAAGAFVDERMSSTTAPRRAAAAASASHSGEINLADLYEPMASLSPEAQRASHFSDVCRQMLADNQQRPRTSITLQVVGRIFGLTAARCLSNLIVACRGSSWLDARRDYAVLPPDAKVMNAKGEIIKLADVEMTAALMAERFKPRLCTISEDQASDKSLNATEMRYEVLPPRQGKNSYSILYYIKRPHERMPFPFIGSLLDWIRPVLWGTRAEWNAIEVDIDRDKFAPESLNFESSNYSANPLSFETTTSSDLHLPAKASGSDKKWTVTLSQKDNRAKTREIESPFQGDTHPAFAFVNWNGDLDLVNSAKLLGYQSLHPMEDVPLSFLDVETYRKEALDLRNAWLKRRQTGHCYLYFPPRKDASAFKVINLVPTQLPSLLTQPS